MEKENVNHNDMLFVDFPEFRVTNETKKDVIQHSEKYYQYGYRIANGMFRTDEEKSGYLEESLERPLPGNEKKCLVFRKILKQIK